MAAKQIGLVDYRLENFHANVFVELLRTKLKRRGWKAAARWAMDAKGGRAWARRKRIPFVDDVRAMADCDALMVLAPSNPETHLRLARLAFPLGKPTYVDKTFATDLAMARRIFRLADRYHVPVITSSALRCSASIRRLAAQVQGEKIRHMQAWGGGRSFDEYAIHPLEMVISVLGPEVQRVCRLGNTHYHQLQLEFSGDRTASVFLHTQAACGFHAMISTEKSTHYVNCDADPFFQDLGSLILDFFESGRETIDRRESLAIRAVLDAARRPEARRRFVRI